MKAHGHVQSKLPIKCVERGRLEIEMNRRVDAICCDKDPRRSRLEDEREEFSCSHA